MPFWNSPSNIGGNTFGAHILELYRKNEYGDPHFFYFMILNSAFVQ